MPKTFYTERDIVDLSKQGVKSLIVDDDIVLTDLAYEMSRRLGLALLRQDDQPPAAPVRPYIAKLTSPSAGATDKEKVSSLTKEVPTSVTSGTGASNELQQKVYQAALARLGETVDPKLLETIVQRVLASISTK